MKNLRCVLVSTLILCLVMLAACTNSSPVNDADERSGQLSIVCDNFAAYDWTLQILGDQAEEVELVYLLDSGVDLHSFQPTVADIAQVADADLFLYVGGESDAWARDALSNATNGQQRSLGLLQTVDDALAEEVVAGMQVEGEDTHKADENALDEHIWLSLRRAQVLVRAIARELQELDPSHADTYQANAEAYAAQLATLDAHYTDTVASATLDTLIFADRFPFRYLTDDYGLTYFAAFEGCSAETEASFETIAFLARKADELKVPALLTIEQSDQRVAKTVRDTTSSKSQQILTMDSLQSVSKADREAGRTYLRSMENNLDVLAIALG